MVFLQIFISPSRLKTVRLLCASLKVSFRLRLEATKDEVAVQVSLPTIGAVGFYEFEGEILGQLRRFLFAGVVAVGSPIFTNQGVPAARVAALRDAFAVTMKDPAYLAAMKKIRLSVHPTSGAALAKIVNNIVNAPPEIIAKARGALSRKGLIKCAQHTDAKYCRKPRKRKKKG